MIKKLFFILCLLWCVFTKAQNRYTDSQLKTITFNQLLEEITSGSDSIYTLENTQVIAPEDTDSIYRLYTYRFNDKAYAIDTLTVNKEITFNNVQFIDSPDRGRYAFLNLKFNKPIHLTNAINFSAYNCTFNDGFFFRESEIIGDAQKHNLVIQDCVFTSKFSVMCSSGNKDTGIILNKNKFIGSQKPESTNFSGDPQMIINGFDLSYFGFTENEIAYDNSSFLIQLTKLDEIYFNKNKVRSDRWNYMMLGQLNSLIFVQNDIKTNLLFDLDKLNNEYDFEWPLTQRKLMPLNYYFALTDTFKVSDNQLNQWHSNDQGANVLYYKNSLTQLSKFHNYFKNFNDRQSANDVYIKIKDLETQRLEYLYNDNPSFENFFELIVIRFLKRFSN